MENLNISAHSSAGRLYLLLSVLKVVEASNTRLDRAWAEVLGLDKEDFSSIMNSVGQVMGLIDEAKQDIASVAANPDLLLYPFPKIETAFKSSNLGGATQNFTNHLSHDIMLGLAHAANYLSEKNVEPALDSTELDQIVGEIDALTKNVKSSNIDPELQVLVVDQLESLRRAIHDYSLHGSRGVKRAFQAAIGAFVVNNALFEREGGVSTKDKMLALLHKIGTALQIAERGMKLLEGLSKLLPKGD